MLSIKPIKYVVLLVFCTFYLLNYYLSVANEIEPRGSNSYQIVTGDDSEDDRRRWDLFYNTRNYVFGKEPSSFLKENIGFFPKGKALDLAMGEGRNAVFMAKKGFFVDGVDISEVALKKAKLLARDSNVTVNAINADLNHYQIRPETYDVILNIDYLQRSLIPEIKKGLKKGGLVIFENYTVEQLGNAQGQQIRRDLLLERGELRNHFKEFEIVVYRESNDGKSAKASLIAKKNNYK